MTSTAALVRDDDPLTRRRRPAHTGSALPAVAIMAVAMVAGAVLVLAVDPVVASLPLAVAVVAGTWSARVVDPRWSWTVPALLRAVEYGTVLSVGVVVEDSGPAAYAALAALAYRHYDLVYRGRALGAGALLTPAADLLGGWQGRTLVVVAAAVAGIATPALWVLAGAVATVAVADTVLVWRTGRARRSTGADVDDEEAW